MSEHEFSEIRQAIFAIVNSLGAALPRTGAVNDTLTALMNREYGDPEEQQI